VIFLIELQQKFLRHIQSNQASKHQSSVVTDFNMLLDKAAFLKRFVKDYAKELFVSPNYLNEKIKEETGKPASFWIHKKTITESKRLLLQKDMPLKEISTALEFQRASHFDRFFKEHEGITPSEFRKQLS